MSLTSPTASVTSERFQILSLDGGGYRGVFIAAVLAGYEQDHQLRIADAFDMIAGTSTGGIIALALGAGLSAEDIVGFYAKNGPKIFGGRGLRSVVQLGRSKFAQRRLRDALEDVFGDKLLADSSVPLCIPSYDLESDDVVVFRTPHHEKLRRDWRESMVDVALATSAAPTFFPAFVTKDGRRLVDGGVWANNPSMVGLTEAITTLDAELSAIRLLSVGTTRDVSERPRKLDRGGVVQWATSIPTVIMRGQSRGVENAVGFLLPKTQILRIDPPVPHGLLGLDKTRTANLTARGSSTARQTSPDFNRVFNGHTPRIYTPIYTPGGSQP